MPGATGGARSPVARPASPRNQVCTAIAAIERRRRVGDARPAEAAGPASRPATRASWAGPWVSPSAASSSTAAPSRGHDVLPGRRGCGARRHGGDQRLRRPARPLREVQERVSGRVPRERPSPIRSAAPRSRSYRSGSVTSAAAACPSASGSPAVTRSTGLAGTDRVPDSRGRRTRRPESRPRSPRRRRGPSLPAPTARAGSGLAPSARTAPGARRGRAARRPGAARRAAPCRAAPGRSATAARRESRA